jgi:hypothetical protein
MTLLHPMLAIIGASLIAIPILIHLLARRRKKPIKWGAMRFLMEAYKKQRKRMTLEQLILLATRCLILLLLALALGRPALEAAGLLGEGSGRTLYLLIDNSLTARARDGETADSPSALDRHKAAARDILAALAQGDRAGLITLGGPSDPIVVPASADPLAVSSFVDRVAPTDSHVDLEGALAALADQLERDAQDGSPGSAEAVVVVLSDFLVGSFDSAAPAPARAALPPGARLAATTPATQGLGNVQILSISPLREVIITGQNEANVQPSEQVSVALRRVGPIVAEPGVTALTARLVAAAPRASADAPGTLRDLAPPTRTTVRWAPGQSEQTVSVRVDGFGEAARSGRAAAIVAQIDRDAIDADNTLRAPVRVRSALRVAIVDRRRFTGAASVADLEPAEWLRLALRPSDNTPLDTSILAPTSIDEPSLAGLDAVVLPRPDLIDADAWTRLRAFADAGGLVIVMPPIDVTVHLWPDAMAAAFDIRLRLAREPVEFEPPERFADEQPRTALTELIRAELPDLLRPITITRALPIEEAGPSARPLLTLADGAPWMTEFRPGSASAADRAQNTTENESAAPQPDAPGAIIYIASAIDLEWTDLPARPLMVPLMQELVRQGVGEAGVDLSITAGASLRAPSRTTELRPLSGDASESQRIALRPDEATPPARDARLYHAVDASGAERGIIAVNPDPTAGRTDPNKPSAVRERLAAFAAPGAPEPVFLDPPTMAATLARADEGSPISLPLLIAALALAAIETVLARFFSHAQRERQSATLPDSSEAAA